MEGCGAKVDSNNPRQGYSPCQIESTSNIVGGGNNNAAVRCDWNKGKKEGREGEVLGGSRKNDCRSRDISDLSITHVGA